MVVENSDVSAGNLLPSPEEAFDFPGLRLLLLLRRVRDFIDRRRSFVVFAVVLALVYAFFSI